VRQSSFGVCALCGARAGKAAMGRHVRACLGERAGRASSRMLIVRAQPPGAPMFWLDVAAGQTAKLKDLDGLLRRVWLECCGHLSEFYRGPRDKVPMNRTIDDVLGSPGTRLGYVYDFGSSTELNVTHAGVVEAASEKKVQVVARNEAPLWPCDVCGQPATMLCAECANVEGGFYCATHAKKHPCGEEMLRPVANSPRMGVCGYSGEA
jgi:hypothetical protein